MDDYNGDAEYNQEDYDRELAKEQAEQLRALQGKKQESEWVKQLDAEAEKVLPKIFDVTWIPQFEHLDQSPIKTLVIGPPNAHMADADRIFRTELRRTGLKLKKVMSIQFLGDCFVNLEPVSTLDEWLNEA
jgi:hypothetical protein